MENLQRKIPIEEAKGIQVMMERLKLTQERLQRLARADLVSMQ